MTTNAAERQSLQLEYELSHPPEKVWRALTEPALIAAWLMSTDMQPVAGKSFTFKSEPTAWWDGVVHCKVLEIDKPRRLQYSWQAGQGASMLDTVVTWTLTPTSSGGTRLGLVHAGFQPSNKFAFGGAQQGWERNIGTLRELLERTA